MTDPGAEYGRSAPHYETPTQQYTQHSYPPPATQQYVPPTLQQDPPAYGQPAQQQRPPSRLWYLGSALLLTVTWPIGLALFIIWAVVLPLSMFVVVAPLLLPVATAIRGYAHAYRRWARRVLGLTGPERAQQAQPSYAEPSAGRPAAHENTQHAKSSYPSREPGLFGKLMRPVRDPMLWREWVWLLANATVGFMLSIVQVVLFVGTWFYLLYPLLYALTPHDVFGTVLGVYELQSPSEAWLVTPLAVVMFALWFALAPVLSAANAKMITSMIGWARGRQV